MVSVPQVCKLWWAVCQDIQDVHLAFIGAGTGDVLTKVVSVGWFATAGDAGGGVGGSYGDVGGGESQGG